MAVQHVEIGLGDAQDEILPGLDEIGFGLGNLKFRLIVGDPVLPAEQRLGQGKRVAVAVEFDIVRNGRPPRKYNIIFVPLGVGRHADVGNRPARACGVRSRPASSVERAAA